MNLRSAYTGSVADHQGHAVQPERSGRPSGSGLVLVLRALSSDTLAQVIIFILLLALWETIARLGYVHPFLLPSLSSVISRIGRDAASGLVFADLGLTLYRAAVGFALAAAVAIPVGVLMARNAGVRWFFDPLVSVGFPMPKISFLPIFILWFGIFDMSKIVMVAFSCFFPLVSAAYAGTLGVDKWVIWSARSFGATPRQVLREIVLPMALPQIMTGIQIAVPTALITTVVTEMLMGGRGIGGSMIQAGRFADSVGVFAGIVEIALLGAIVVRSVEMLRMRLLAWHPEARR
jgi:ABC-type nitrate/sulfonate/bicarbonate transport system permease component